MASTTFLLLKKPARGDPDWDIDVNENSDKIDLFASAVNDSLTTLGVGVASLNVAVVTINGYIDVINSGITTINEGLVTINGNLTSINSSIIAINTDLINLESSKADKVGTVDIEITDKTKGLILNSDTKRWRLIVDDDGILSTEEVV
jgi:hypothetical protein